MAFIAGKRIAISGAGVGGTAFALALEQACKARGIIPMPAITIYERDASASARENVGYSFSLKQHGETGPGGLQVVRQLQKGIFEELEGVQESSSTTHICWKGFKPLVEVSVKPLEGSNTQTIFRIMRTRLRQTLLSRLPPGVVQYGKVCVSARPPAGVGQPVHISFRDGTTSECDMLVVADGANSKLRAALLPHEASHHTGICMLYGRTGPLEQLPPEIQKGHYLSLGHRSTTLFMGAVDRNTVMWSLSFKAPRSRADELNTLLKDPSAAQEFLEREVPKMASGISEPLPSVLRQTPASSLTAYAGMDKPPHPMDGNGIAYLGDAWHPMTPFSGAGANMALQDAWELAQQLTNGHHSSMQAAISQYATDGAPRSAEVVESGRKVIAVAHCDGWRKLLVVAVVWAAGLLLRLKVWQPFASIARSRGIRLAGLPAKRTA